MLAPIQHAQLVWMLHPLELFDLISRNAVDLMALQLHTAVRLAGKPGPDLVVPQADDTRFADPVWTQETHWSLLKQWYLFYTRHVQNALFATPWLSPKERRRAAFWWRKWLNAAAPTNFLPTNPVAMRKAVETNGESLRRGFEIYLEDLRAGTVRMTSPEDFRVGGNLATTPGAVVFRNRLLELIHYTPVANEVHRAPIVIVTPWINKYYVLDLTPKKSMVGFLLERGFDVYITSWRNPTPDMAETSFDDYLTQGVDEAVRVARTLSGADKVHAVGYCIGGTLLAVYLAWLNRRQPENVPVQSWTLLASLTDFQSPGDIEVFIDEAGVRWLTDLMRRRGYLDGREMATTFRLLRSNSLIWHYMVHGWLYGEKPAPWDVLYWNMDATRMPYRMHEYYLREMYLKNNLVKSDALTVAGEPIDLVRIHQPLYDVSAEDDHIAPWRQTFKINGYVTSPKRFVLSSSGHILGIVNPPVAPPKRSYRIGPAHRGQSADHWHAQAEQRDGSWWEDWSDWLAGQCGPLGAPPPLASSDFPQLAAAPGTYVLEP
ncbi:MAG: alpha/beta hydrolase [Betaproteobacteria bacterium RIFCSPLOWO2_12_FULL_67_28]|nr:MAG: alpha/beta hydrolase [Betaproteobacteria bacterium RIFCSPLOWO2_02_FULL_68_150]OGA68526.1 MAG: alpha/beta hydrolase [Betaproteobacteria bacterium RIFCSPLOWO2_12_FULL_67_28]